MSKGPEYISPEQLRRLFPGASASTLKLNDTNLSVARELPRAETPLRVPPPDKLEEMRRLVALGIRPTTDETKLNKTEKRYLAWLEQLQPMWIGVQSITLKLGHDCRLTMDFAVLDREGLRLVDTKATNKETGKALVEEDAMIKMRLAARLYPWIRFVIAHENGLVWEHVEVKP